MFEVGQKVLCVDDKRRRFPMYGLAAGTVYTVASIEIHAHWTQPGIRLVEIKIPPPDAYAIDRFRPLDDKEDSVEIFRKMARDTEKKTILPISYERLKELMKEAKIIE